MRGLRPPHRIQVATSALVALGGAIVAVLRCCVEYFTPFDLECVLRSLEPLLLLFQTPRGGNKPLTGILLLRVPVRRYVVRTIIFDIISLFGLIFRIAVVRQWFALLQRWVCMIAISAEAGFRAALAPPL